MTLISHCYAVDDEERGVGGGSGSDGINGDMAYSTIHMRNSSGSIDVRINDDDDDDHVEEKEDEDDYDDDHCYSDHGQNHYHTIQSDLTDMKADYPDHITHDDTAMTNITAINSNTIPTTDHDPPPPPPPHHVIDPESTTRFMIG